MVRNLFVQAISNGCSSGLIDDTQDIQSRDGSSVFGGLTLGVIEVSRNCDNCIVHRLKERVRPWVSQWYVEELKSIIFSCIYFVY